MFDLLPSQPTVLVPDVVITTLGTPFRALGREAED